MTETIPNFASREELETEVIRLRAALAEAGVDAQRLSLPQAERDTRQHRTTEHLAAATLKEAQEHYRLAAKATNDAVWDWDLTNDRLLWNEALEQCYGHRPATVKMIGEWWIGHIHPDDRARIQTSIHDVIGGTGVVWTDEYRFRRADGSYAVVLDRAT